MSFVGHVDRLSEPAVIASLRSKEQEEGRLIAAPLAMRSERAVQTRGFWLQKRIVSRYMRLYQSVRALCPALAMVMTIPGVATATDLDSGTASPRVPSSVNRELEAGLPELFKICHDQTYALCAVASCYVFNQVAYCKCDVESGDSISLPFDVDGEDVCDVNANGPANGYIVSTFSVPDLVLQGGDTALYTCRAGASDGAYAQCDGGLCFTSTEASPSFPGFDEPLTDGQIICSCPITIADPDQATFGYQIAGPFPCEDSFFENCQSVKTNNRTGTHIPVGAPTGTARILALLLNGPPVPPLNVCPSPGNSG
jgi:hypothetical protein